MSQRARAPELFCQRMSGLLSPLKSPEPTIFQEVATDGRKMLLPKVVPFMSQRAREPEVFCQRMSALPSPLKSLFMARGAEDTILKKLPLPLSVIYTSPFAYTPNAAGWLTVKPSTIV